MFLLIFPFISISIVIFSRFLRISRVGYHAGKPIETVVFWLRAVIRKYRLRVCKMKKSKIPKLSQNIGLGKLFLEK